MQFVSLIVAASLTLLPGRGGFTGTWALDRERSDFGAADMPNRFVLQLEQAGDHISATTFTADRDGMRVSYRECCLEPRLDGALSCIAADGVSADEIWQVTAPDELTITRAITGKTPPSRQRLVLARSTLLEYTHARRCGSPPFDY